ncbi:MAG: restriction endonuclease subunit S [Lachnospiraceae bacterium]|nr:restriction endonuclease subunit S [Lachnospiraceae bacterium]
MKLSDALKSSILQDALQGKLTNQHMDDISVKSLLAVLQLNEQITDEYSVPENWAIINLGDLCDIKNGFTPKRSVEEYWNPKEVPWFTVEDVKSQGHIIYSTQQMISRAALGNSTERIVPADTVLLCCTSATIGNYAIAKIPLTTNQQWNGLVIKSEFSNFVLTDYLLCWVKTLKEKLIGTGKSTTFPFVSVRKLSSFKVPLPPIEEQQRIVDRVNELLAKVGEFEKIENRLTALKEKFPSDLRAAILQAAMQGELTEQLDTDSSVDDLLEDIRTHRDCLIADGVYRPK